MRASSLPALVAFSGPFLTGLACVSSEGFYRSDAAVLRRFGDVPSFLGSPSVALSLPFHFLPLGDVQLRATLPSVFALGVSGLLIYWLTLRLLRGEGGHSRFDVWLSLGATLASSLSLPFLGAATLLGGGAVGACLGLGLLLALGSQGPSAAPRRRAYDRALGAARFVALPVLAAGLLLESPPLLGVLGVAWFFRSLGRSSVARPRAAAAGTAPWLRALGYSGCFLLGLIGFLLPQGARLLDLHLELQAGAATLARPTASEHHPLALIGEMGFVWLPAALFGLSQAFLHSTRRVAPLAVVIGLDLVMPSARDLGWLHVEPESSRAALHLVALAVWASLGAVGLRTLAVLLVTLRLRGARLSGALLSTLGLSSALAGAEDAVRLLERTSDRAVVLYSERLLRELPPRALVLGRSRLVVEHILAAQALGERPDVLVVPEPALGLSRYLSEFLRAEPALSQLILDLNLAATPSEHALYRLTDERPVFVEVNPKWDTRLLAHLEPRAGLALYRPNSLIHAERRAVLDREEAIFAALLQATRAGIAPDDTTYELQRAHAEATRQAMVAVGDTASAERLSPFTWEGANERPAPGAPSPGSAPSMAPPSAQLAL